jgi:hypothetical protein
VIAIFSDDQLESGFAPETVWLQLEPAAQASG